MQATAHVAALDQLSNKLSDKPAQTWIEARHTYMNFMMDVLVPIVYETMYSIYQDAVELSKDQGEVEDKFRDFLREVRVWPINVVEGETQNVVQRYAPFAKLIKAVCVSNVMVLSAAQLNRPNATASKLRLNIPSCSVFVQTVYTNVASRFFDRPNLFRSGLTSDQTIANKEKAYEEIRNAIETSVRSLIPIPQVIESSMNFRGNNPIISTRAAPSARLSRPPQTTRPLPGVPPPLQPEEKRKSTMKITLSPQKVMSNSTVRLSNPTPRKSELVPPTKAVKTPATDLAPLKGSERIPSEGKPAPRVSGIRDSQPTSRISFAAPDAKKFPPPRPSHFQQRTASDAIKTVMDELDIKSDKRDTISSSSSSDDESIE